MNILSVNEVIDSLNHYVNQPIYVTGLLICEFEELTLNHLPKKDFRLEGYLSSLWIECANGLKFNNTMMEALSYKQVLVEGKLYLSDGLCGCGHMGLYPAELVVTDIERYKNR